MAIIHARPPSLLAPRLAAAVLLLVAAARLPAGGASPAGSLSIDVRSSVDQRWSGIHKGGAITQGKVYGIAAIREATSDEKLLKPVDEARVLRQLRAELNARGFVEITAGQKPDVVLTLHYGRGFLRNPYTEGMMLGQREASGQQTATIIMPDQVFRSKMGPYETKLQSAQAEKLFLRVTAWNFPAKPEDKRVQLWQTTMLVDDPAHLDLNLVTGEMLAAGADYFDRAMKGEEVTVNTALPKGSVTLGPLEIIETVPKGK